MGLQNDVTEARDFDTGYQLAVMTAGAMEEGGQEDCLPEPNVHAVLQTYTVPLAQVRKELKD